MALRERLVGLLLIAAGLASMAVVYWFWQHRTEILPQPPVPPPGLPPGMMPMLSPLDCVVPIAAIGSTALTLEGLRRLINPDAAGPNR